MNFTIECQACGNEIDVDTEVNYGTTVCDCCGLVHHHTITLISWAAV